MKIKIDGMESNDFTKRFKWINLNYKTKIRNETVEMWNDGAEDMNFKVIRDEGEKIETIPAHFKKHEPYPNFNLEKQPKFVPNIPDYNSWCGDPQHILYDEKTGLYFMWSIARCGKGFKSDWFEWTSTDMKSWRCEGIRLKRVRDLNGASEPSIVGGSVIISDGRFVPKGHLMYVVTVQPGWRDDRGHFAEVSGGDHTCVFLAEDFGKPIYAKYHLNDSLDVGGDYRDSYAFYDNGQLYVAIASGADSIDPKNNGGVVISRINSLDWKDWNSNIDFLKSEPMNGKSVDYGVEVPNVIRLNKGRWLVLYSDQYLGNRRPLKQEKYQTCKGWICSRENEKFNKIKFIQLDFGPDAYARRVCNPYSNKEAPYVTCCAMMYNWAGQGPSGNGQDFAKGIMSFDPPYLLRLSDNNFMQAKFLLEPTRTLKGSDFTNPIIMGGITFLKVGNRLTYTYPAGKINTWDWVSEDHMYINDDDVIVMYEDGMLLQVLCLTSGYNMSFKK